MSVLAPLYVLGALAISLPILFHLLRRSPRGRVPFSSLMFLAPSPPRITRRSRLDQWLLLLLRAAALGLIALAFARPFLREAALLTLGGEPGRSIAILVDTSASMQRGNLWAQATARASEVIDGARPGDRIALFTFDDEVREEVGFDEPVGIAPRERAGILKGRISGLRPTWGATELGGALIATADALEIALDSAPSTPEAGAPSRRALQLVVVTDLQRGSRFEALASYAWPERVRVSVERVALPRSSNAGLSLLAGEASAGEDGPYRVLVANESDSAEERFALSWANARSDRLGDLVASVVVPPGEARVVPAARPADDAGADRLRLGGDDEDFDNVSYVAHWPREELTVLYAGREAADDPDDLRYYAERAFAPSGRRDVRVLEQAADEPLSPDGPPPRLIVVTEDVEAPLREGLLRYLKAGGTVLYVLREARATPTLQALLGTAELAVEEAEASDYAMLGEIDFSHPLFAPFGDPRFGDFTRIRFWRHRRLRISGEESGEARVLARFDDGDPALVERPHDRGRAVILTSGWHPADSQLSRSSKFVPLLAGLLEGPAGGLEDQRSFHIHDLVPIPPAANGSAPRRIFKPDGTEIPLEAGGTSFRETDQPGIYELVEGDDRRRFAVNLSPSESRTSPLAVEELENMGVRLGVELERTDTQRQLRDLELEGSQKLWKWLVVAVLGLLIIETGLAGRRARAANRETVPT